MIDWSPFCVILYRYKLLKTDGLWLTLYFITEFQIVYETKNITDNMAHVLSDEKPNEKAIFKSRHF